MFLSFLFSCNPKDRIEIEKSASAFDIEQGRTSIIQSNQNFMKAFRASDSTGVSNCYTTDANVMEANIPAIVGREEIKHFISSIILRGIKDFQITTLKIWGDSSILAEVGTYILAAGTQIDKGKCIVLWNQNRVTVKCFVTFGQVIFRMKLVTKS